MVSTPYGDIHERFLTIEEDLDLFSFRLDGIRIWEWILYDVFQDVMFSTGVWHHHEPLGKGLVDRLLRGYLLARNAVLRNPFLSPDSDVLYYGHPRRMRMDDGYWWDIYCDPIHESTDMDYLHVEEPFLNRHFRPARTDKLRYLDLIHYAGTLREELGLDRASPSDGERRTLHAIEERIRADFETDVDVTGKEDIGYVAIEPGTGTANGRAFEVGVQSGIDHEWSTIEFDGTYTEPAFIADMQTVAGPDSSGLRYRNLTESSVDVRVEEEQSNDDEVVHAEEDVGYLVAGAASSEATPSPSPEPSAPEGETGEGDGFGVDEYGFDRFGV